MHTPGYVVTRTWVRTQCTNCILKYKNCRRDSVPDGNTISTKPHKLCIFTISESSHSHTHTWRLCYFKVCIMWIGHIILTHSNPFGVKSSWRTDASPMLCQTCAFYLVTKQPCCFISTAEPAGNALLNFVGDMTSSGWNVWKQTLSLSFIRAFCLS